MFNFIKGLMEQEKFDSAVPVFNGTNGTSPTGTAVGAMDTSINTKGDVQFTNNRIAVNSQDVNASEVSDYLGQAQKINDGVECVGFAVELDDGQLVKLYVAKSDAEKFEDDLASALGSEEEFEDILIKFSEIYDVVDVIWPDDTYGSQTPSMDEPTQDTLPSTPDVQPDEANAVDAAPVDDDTGLQAKITQKANSDTSATPEAETDTPPDETNDITDEPKSSNTDEVESGAPDENFDKDKSEFDELFGADDEKTDSPEDTETETKTDSENTTDPDAQEQDANTTSSETSDAEQSSDEPKKVDDEDDVSVVIHPKKKKEISESKEEFDSTKNTGGSDLFKTLGLDSQYSTLGAKLETIVGKRILAILGFIGIPGSLLSKLTGIEEAINSAADHIASNASIRNSFNKIFHKIISTEQQEKYADVEYRDEFEHFLNVIGLDLSKIKNSRQAVSAILFGAHCISDPETKVAFETFMNTSDEDESEGDSLATKINESIEGDSGRSHQSFDKVMKSQYSEYRKWMSREEQLELLNWYLSGSEIHVFHLHEDDGAPEEQIPHGLHVFATSPVDDGILEVITLEKPLANISH